LLEKKKRKEKDYTFFYSSLNQKDTKNFSCHCSINKEEEKSKE
jgi:hypothetical protein